MAKNYLCIVSLFLCIYFNNFNAFAETMQVTGHDDFINTDVNFYDGDGNKVYLEDFEGESVLLVFWATWCGTCTSEVPALDNLQKDFRKLPFKVIALSQDYQGSEVIRKHFTEHGIRHLQVYHDKNNALFRDLGIVGLPTTYFINSGGKLKLIFKGHVKWQNDVVRKMLVQEIGGEIDLPKNSYKENLLNQAVTKEEQPNINTDKKAESANDTDKKAK